MARLALNLAGPIADVQGDAVLIVPLPLRKHQLFRTMVREERRQANAVIGGTRLFTERHDSVLARHIALDQLFAETLSHHPVANDNDGFLPTCSVLGSAHCRVLITALTGRNILVHSDSSMRWPTSWPSALRVLQAPGRTPLTRHTGFE